MGAGLLLGLSERYGYESVRVADNLSRSRPEAVICLTAAGLLTINCQDNLPLTIHPRIEDWPPHAEVSDVRDRKLLSAFVGAVSSVFHNPIARLGPRDFDDRRRRWTLHSLFPPRI